MLQDLNSLRETFSQTAGPYVHIGLAPDATGFDIYDKELRWDIARSNAADPAFNLIEWNHRRATPIAERQPGDSPVIARPPSALTSPCTAKTKLYFLIFRTCLGPPIAGHNKEQRQKL